MYAMSYIQLGCELVVRVDLNMNKKQNKTRLPIGSIGSFKHGFKFTNLQLTIKTMSLIIQYTTVR